MLFTKNQVNRAFKKGQKEMYQFKDFELLRLKDFLVRYSDKIDHEMILKKNNKESPYDILCLVDTRENVCHTMSENRKRKLKKSGSAKRRKTKVKYHYDNIFNRIHGYLLLEDLQKNKNIPRDKKVLSLSLICSSYYSNMKGVGTLLMKSMISLAEICEYTDIILEVANEHAGSEESDEESDEESGEESGEESSDESDEESGEESGESDEEIWVETVNQPLIDCISREFTRKILRIAEDGTAHYSIGEDYIEDIIYSYIEDEYESECYEYEYTPVDLSDPGETEYGGYYYTKGKRARIELYQYYEKFGFIEDMDIHFKWKAFTTDPFPSMIKHL